MLDQLESKYVLGEILGRGGMGIVYAATLRSLDLRVAVKVPHPDLMRDAFVANRFRIEALAGDRVDHENVARVIDFGGAEDGARAPASLGARSCAWASSAPVSRRSSSRVACHPWRRTSMPPVSSCTSS